MSKQVDGLTVTLVVTMFMRSQTDYKFAESKSTQDVQFAATYSSWQDLQKARADVERSTCPLRVRTSEAVTDRDLMHYVKKRVSYQCIHSFHYYGSGGGSRGNGMRKTETKESGCLFHVSYELKLQSMSGKYVFERSKNHRLVHNNHELSHEGTRTYSKDRKVCLAGELKEAATLIRVGASTSLISHRTSLTRKEISNVKLKVTQQDTALVEQVLRTFRDERGLHYKIFKGTDGLVDGVCFQTPVQKMLLQHYGDTVLVDATYNTNSNGYSFLGILITANDGKGMPVATMLSRGGGAEKWGFASTSYILRRHIMDIF